MTQAYGDITGGPGYRHNPSAALEYDEAMAQWLQERNEKPYVTEQDIDYVAEIEEADEDALAEYEYDREVAECCGGRDFNCGHYGHGYMSKRDFKNKYDLWDHEISELEDRRNGYWD